MSVVVVDSGLGGLSIVESILSRDDTVDLHYVLDSDFFPYGEKTKGEIFARLQKLVSYFLDRYLVDQVVVACNSASTYVLAQLREAFPNINFVGVVPAVKPAAQLSVNKQLLILATEATCSSQYLQKLIRDYASDCRVEALACPELVVEAEKSIDNKPRLPRSLLADISSSEADTLVLGCTHFPLMRDELEQQFPSKIFVDSNSAIAERVLSLPLQQNQFRCDTRVWYTGLMSDTKKRAISTRLSLSSYPELIRV